jgi:uncharacterized protein involved in exopolysaccharide biosynthesis
MQGSPDSISVPRRQLDFEDYVDIVRRNLSWILGPLFAGLVIGVMVAFFWPDTYLAWSTLRIVPAQVPDRVIPTNFNRQMADRLTSVLSEITTSGKLQPLITELGIYKSDLARKPFEDVAEDMKKAIRVQPMASGLQENRAGYLFQIHFRYRNRKDAIQTVKMLASLVKKTSEQQQAVASNDTTVFLRDQQASAKKELDALETVRSSFRQKKMGSLPEQFQANMQALQSLQMQLSSVNEAINRGGQEKLMLETQLQNIKEQAKTVTATQEDTSVKNERLVQLNRAILDMETAISAQRETYREEHPDIRSNKARLEVLKRERDRLMADEEKTASVQSTKKSVTPTTKRALTDLEAMQRNIESRIQITVLDLAERAKTQQRLLDQISRVQKMVESTPAGEDEYARISRDYQTAKTRYDDLTLKLAQSEMANKVEQNLHGEMLEILEDGVASSRPVEPNRWIIVGAGITIGLMLGAGLVSVREAKDGSLKTLKDVRAYTNVTVLSTVPLLENAVVLRRKRRLTFLGWSTAMIVGVVLMTSSIYYYFFYAAQTATRT